MLLKFVKVGVGVGDIVVKRMTDCVEFVVGLRMMLLSPFESSAGALLRTHAAHI